MAMSIANRFNEVKKMSFERANEHKIVWIKDEDLLDNPRNHVDTEYTEDIETHITNQGFAYELTVTAFNAPKGKYYIISGHRRRKAGRLKGYKEFPCIVKDYASDIDAFEALLTANAARRPDRDPLLYAVWYKDYSELLDMKGFTGSYREEIAKRLGLSVKQADKYKAFLKIIPEFWVKVRTKELPMEPLLTLATLSDEEQRDILNIFEQVNPEHFKLNSATCTEIIQNYKKSQREPIVTIDLNLINPYTEFHINNEQHIEESPRDEEKELNEDENVLVEEHGDFETKQDVYEEKSILARMGGRIEKYVVGSNDSNKASIREKMDLQHKYKDEIPAHENNQNQSDTPSYKEINAQTICKYITLLDKKMDEDWKFATDEAAIECMKSVGRLINDALIFLENINVEHKQYDIYKDIMADVLDNASKL